MPVTVPESGDPITKASVTGMYDDVRAVVNAQDESTVSRATFGIQHVPSIVQQAEFLEVTTPVTVTGSPYGFGTPPPTFDEITTIGTWQVLAPYTFDNGGAGFTLNGGIVLMYCSIRWSEQAVKYGSGAAPGCAQELWFNFNYTVNGVLYQLPQNSRMLRNTIDMSYGTLASPSVPVPDPSFPQRVEETVTWWHVLDLRALTPTFNFKMGVKAMTQRATGPYTSDCTLPNGHIGFVNLYGG